MIELARRSQNDERPLGINRMCKILSAPRSAFYRNGEWSAETDTDLRDSIQRIALEFSSYGYRRITKELALRGLLVNHKRVLRLMRQDNLLCIRKRAFARTTDSRHGLPIYPNLTTGLELSGVNQLWVSDITYIRLPTEFVYLAIILDVHSRKCIGWSLGRRLDDNLTCEALLRALDTRQIGTGLIHHSDRGVQYASKKYTDLLKDNGIRISMSRKGNPYDNAYAESFMKTLKYEEVYLCDYENFDEALTSIRAFIDEVYNRKRLHSSIGYLPPAQYELRLASANQNISP
jgi:putative transposase